MKYLYVLLLISLPFFLMAQEGSPKAQYVGVKKCKTCHKKVEQGEQFRIWSESKHAQAFETLKSEKAAQIAKEKGLSKPAYESPECLKCHVTAYDAPAEMLAATFKKEDGVQCETCHGAGSLYKKKKIMKDRELAIQNGLNPISVKDGSAEKLCRKCHNEESPTFKEFNFKERWEKIAHPVPAKKEAK